MRTPPTSSLHDVVLGFRLCRSAAHGAAADLLLTRDSCIYGLGIAFAVQISWIKRDSSSGAHEKTVEVKENVFDARVGLRRHRRTFIAWIGKVAAIAVITLPEFDAVITHSRQDQNIGQANECIYSYGFRLLPMIGVISYPQESYIPAVQF